MENLFSIFVDIDGCLIDNTANVGKSYYEAANKIAELSAKSAVGLGPQLRLCSGRGKTGIEMTANFFGMNNCFMIGEGGTIFYNHRLGKPILNPAIPSAYLKTLAHLKAKEVPAILENFAFLQKNSDFSVCACLYKPFEDLGDVEKTYNLLRDAKYHREKWSLRKWILKRQIRLRLLAQRYITISPPGVSKGSAIRRLAAIEEINLPYSIAVGDTEMDFSMFRQVGRIGCPANATPRCIDYVKQRRGKVSLLPCVQGVWDVIDWYLHQG